METVRRDDRWDKFQTEEELIRSVVGDELTDMDKIKSGRKQHADRIAEWLSLGPEDVVVDLGSGIGLLAEHIAPLVREVHCMDIGKHHIEFTEKYLSGFANVECHYMGYADFSSVAGKGVNKIYSSAVLIHFNSWDLYNYLSAIGALLRKGGQFYFNFMEAERLEPTENRLFQKNLARYNKALSSSYLVTWNSFAYVESLAKAFGFSLERVIEFPFGNTGVLLTKT